MFSPQLFVLQPDPWKSHYCGFPVKTCNEDETVDAIQDVKIKTRSALNVVKTKLTSRVFRPSILIFFWFVLFCLCISVGQFESSTLCINRHSIDSSVTIIICVCAELLIHDSVGTIMTLVHPEDNKGTAEWLRLLHQVWFGLCLRNGCKSTACFPW